MKRIIITLLLVATGLTSVGCAPKPLYYWGDYSNTLYRLRKDANDETRAKHMAELEAIVDKSNGNSMRVPPGVCCELGYMLAQKGNNKRAMEYFVLEKSTYPESTILVDRLIERIKTADDSTKESTTVETQKSGS